MFDIMRIKNKRNGLIYFKPDWWATGLLVKNVGEKSNDEIVREALDYFRIHNNDEETLETLMSAIQDVRDEYPSEARCYINIL